MKFRKNLFDHEEEIKPDEVIEVDFEDNSSPTDYALWFQQLMKLNSSKRRAIRDKSMLQIRESKPDLWQFIKNFKLELVGISPRIEYTLVDSSDGDIDVTWIHSFSLPTLLFWSPVGKFGLFVNPNLDYNDTVLNKNPKNRKQKLRGFTA